MHMGSRPPGRALLAPWIATGLVAGLAFTLRLVPVLRGGGLTGVLSYDDGVYYGAANALLSGRLPYRDFALLHPPGITIALTPFAALGRLTTDAVGLAVGRVAFMAIGAGNAVLALHVGRRAGWVAGISAGLFYACVHTATYAERSTILEPLGNLGLLTALLLAGGRERTTRCHPWLAGAAIGAAAAVKLWAVAPALVLALWLWRRRGLPVAGRFAGGATLACAGICLPFALTAPSRFLRLVVIDQLLRPRQKGIGARLMSMAGLRRLGALGTPGLAVLAALLVVVLVAGVALTVLVAVVEPEARIWSALLVVLVADLVASKPYFAFYAAHIVPAAALVVGTGAQLLGDRLARLGRAVGGQAVAAAVGALALVTLAVPVVTTPEGQPMPAGARKLVQARPGCVTSDSAALLIATNVLTRDFNLGCPVIIDVSGTTFDVRSPGTDPHAASRREVDGYITSAPTMLSRGFHNDRFSPSTMRRVLAMQLVYSSPGLAVRVAREPKG